MNVHEAMSKHANKQHQHLVRFTALDERREQAIAEAVALCEQGLPFSVNQINQLTSMIREHAKQGISPLRQLVNEEMIRDYVRKKLSNHYQASNKHMGD